MKTGVKKAEEVRLQKYLSQCGEMSRRAAEKEIEAGNITVNGRKASLGDKVVPGRDTVKLNGRKISIGSPRHTYIMLNKPAGYVTTLSDEKGRKTVDQLVADLGVRVWPVGRLDLNSEGLLLMTDDGELTNKLTHPSHGIPKIYHVRIRGILTPEQFEGLGKPIEIDGRMTLPLKPQIIDFGEDFTTVRLTLHEGRNRQIRRICEREGLNILRLKRVAIGDIALGRLRAGQWQELTPAQVEYLKNC